MATEPEPEPQDTASVLMDVIEATTPNISPTGAKARAAATLKALRARGLTIVPLAVDHCDPWIKYHSSPHKRCIMR